jgi:hypothetical protein
MVEALLEALGKAYGESKVGPANKMTSPAGKEFPLCPLGAESFVNYDPTELHKNFRVLAVDGGSVSLFDTPYWGLGLIKLKARLIEFDTRRKRAVTVKQEASDSFVLYTNDATATDGDLVSRKFWEKGNYLKREEMRFTRKVLKDGIDAEDLLLVDGALSMQRFYEKELLKMHPNTLGISKRSGFIIKRASAAGFLAMKAKDLGKAGAPWYCYPLVAHYPTEDPLAEIMFASFAPHGYAFRVDFPFEVSALNPREQHAYLREQLSKIGLFSFDPKYKSYPYPLGAVHSDSVMRPIDQDRARKFIEGKVLAARMDEDTRALIAKDIENEYWYDQFRRRAH